MAHFLDPEQAVEEELVCYYNLDEPYHPDFFHGPALAERGWQSAGRLRHRVGEDRVPALIDLLEAMMGSLNHPMTARACQSSLFDVWGAPEDWDVFRGFVAQIVTHLRAGPTSRPLHLDR